MSETRNLKVVIAGDAKSARAALKVLGVGLDEADRKAKKSESGLTKLNDTAQASASIFSKMADVAGDAGKSLLTGTVNLTTNLFNLIIPAIIGITALSTAFTWLAPAVLLAGGAMGSAATAAVGLVAVGLALKLGLGGISDAFSEVMTNGEASAETMDKLSLNGQRLVKVFEGFRQPLQDLKKFVQDKLLDDMAEPFKALAEKWIPAARSILGDMATDLNVIGRKAMAALGNDTFINNLRIAASGFGAMLRQIGETIPGLIDSFGRLAKASVPFLQELGGLIAGSLDNFSKWIKTADDSGALKKFMEDAAKSLRDIWNIGGLVVSIMGDLIQILFPGSKRSSDDFLGNLQVGLEKLHAWLSNPDSQKKIQDWIQQIQDFKTKVTEEWIPKAEEWMTKIDGWILKFEGWGNSILTFKNNVVAIWEDLKTGTQSPIDGVVGIFEALPGRIQSGIAALPDMVWGLFRNVVTGAADIVGQGIGNILGFFLMMPYRVVSALSALPGMVANVFHWVADDGSRIAGGMVNDVVRILAALPYRAVNALGNLGNLLLDAGASLMNGFIQGIENQIPGLSYVLKKITDMIPKEKGPISKDRVLLKPAGMAIMGSLVDGFDAGIPKVRGKLNKLTYDISGGSGLASRSLSDQSTTSGVNVTVHVGGSVTAERDLAKAIALSIRDEIVRSGRRNGGKTGLV